jgi:hypothetical protein
MPPLVTRNAVIMCVHGGQVTLIPKQTQVTIQGGTCSANPIWLAVLSWAALSLRVRAASRARRSVRRYPVPPRSRCWLVAGRPTWRPSLVRPTGFLRAR